MLFSAHWKSAATTVRSLNVPGAKERHLLAALAAAFPAAVSVDQLLETLWDGAPPRTGRKSLQAHVVRLRTALEPGRAHGVARAVRRTPPGRLRPRGGARPAGRDRVRGPRGPWPGAAVRGRRRDRRRPAPRGARRCGAASRTPTGRTSPTSSPSGTRLEGIHDHVLEAFWEAELALGRHAEAVPELGRLVAEQPLQEDVVGAARPGALPLPGGRATRWSRSASARTVLDDELGVEPGVRLRELEQAILAQDPALDLQAPPAAAPTAEASWRDRHRVPLQGTRPLRGSTTLPCSTAATGWSAPWSPLSSTTGCSWCPGPAARASRRWCAPVCCPRSARARSPAATSGGRSSSYRARAPSTAWRR